MVYVPFGRWLPFGARSKSEPHLRTAHNVYPLVDGSYAPWLATENVQGTTQTAGFRVIDAMTFGEVVTDPSSGEGDAICYAGTEGKLRILATGLGGGNFADVTRAVGGDYATPTPQNGGTWQFALKDGQAFATNYVDDVQVRDHVTSSATKFAALAGSPPKARCISVFEDFLVLGQLDDASDDPLSALHWSAAGDVTSWTPGTDLSDRRTFPEHGRLTGFSYDQGALYVYFERAILRGVFVGPPQIIRFDVIWRGAGPEQPTSIARGDNRDFWCNRTGFYERVGDSVSQIDLEEGINRSAPMTRVQLARGAVDTRRKIVVWMKVQDGAGSDIRIFNYAIRRWASSNAYTLEGLHSNPETNTAFAPVTKSGMLLGFRSDTNPPTAPFTFLSVSGAGTFTATFSTSDIVDKENGRRLGVRAVRPDCGGSATVQLAARETEGASVTFGTAVATGASGRASIRANGRYLNARVQVTPGTFSTERSAMGLELELTEGGRGKR